MNVMSKINSIDITFELLTTEKGRIHITCSTKSTLELSTLMHKVCIKMMDDFKGQPTLQSQHNSVCSHSTEEKRVPGFRLCSKCSSSHKEKSVSEIRIPEHLV